MLASTPDLVGLAFSPEVRDDPYPLLRLLRETVPVVETPFGWLLTRHADCVEVTRDPRLSNDGRNAVPDATPASDRVREAEDIFMLFLDPPDHTRLRALVNKAFTPRTIQRLRSRAEHLVDGMLDAAEARGDHRLDVIAELAYPLPVVIICELLGVPPTDRDTLQGWSRDLAAIADPTAAMTAEQQDKVHTAGQAFTEYFTQLIDHRQRTPGDDLLSVLSAAEHDSDRLTRRELLTMLLFLFVAGHETTASLIGNGTLALLRNPDQLTRLHDDLTLGPSAIEELLRFDTPVQLTQRFTLDDYDLGGVIIPARQRLVALLGAANRDPDAFPDPDHLDLGRDGAHRHLAFGGGPHFCLGAALARLESEIAITALVQRFPTMELADEPTRRPTVTLRGLDTLPISTRPATAQAKPSRRPQPKPGP